MSNSAHPAPISNHTKADYPPESSKSAEARTEPIVFPVPIRDPAESASADTSTSKAAEADKENSTTVDEDLVPHYAPPPEAETKNAGHIVVDFPEPPPFSTYEAEFYEDHGDIVSHDAHLNSDGEALYRFLLTHAQDYPTYVVSATGTHLEHRTRTVYRTVNGQSRPHTESYTVTITDFHFGIDLASEIVTGPVHCSRGDSEPAYRGLMVRQVDTPEGRRKATDEEKAAFKTWEQTRTAHGLAPWIQQDSTQDSEIHPLQSAKTMRDWADEYCASPKYLKQFTYEKTIHGWDISMLEDAIRSAIGQTMYRGAVDISFQTGRTKIHVRADNRLSRTLSRTLYKVLLWLCLVYPFIWLFKRYHSRGGGRWEICMGAYALKHTEVLGEECPLAEGDVPRPGRPPARYRVVQDERGRQVKLVGIREVEFFNKWEQVIQNAVKSGLQQYSPMLNVADGPVDHAAALEDLPL